MEKVYIRRQFSDHLIGKVFYESLRNIHWSSTSGGVYNIAPQPFIHAYVWCDQVEGEIAHSCQHGPPPHSIKIVILKKDNRPEILEKLLSVAGPRPVIHRAKPYRADEDVKRICNALINGEEHPAIEFKNHKTRGKIFIIKPKNIECLVKEGTENTISARAKRVNIGVAEIMSKQTGFNITEYGYWLTYKKKD